MFLLRAALLAVSAITLVLGVCEGDDKESVQRTMQKAQQAAMAHAGDDPNNPPTIGQSFDCAINPQRTPAPPQPTFSAVHGQCIWNVEPQGNSWIVSFSETWFCKDWAAKVANYPDCDGATGNHQWQYLVDLNAGTVDTLSDRGQFAPDM